MHPDMNGKTVTIFADGEEICAISDLKNGNFINDLSNGMQLGLVVDASDVQITPEAVALLNSCPREGGSFAPIMLTISVDGNKSIGVWGTDGEHRMPALLGSRCSRSVLDSFDTIEHDPEWMHVPRMRGR